jgi:hypothetical protein
MKFSEKLAASEGAEREHTDVTVALHSATKDRWADLEARRADVFERLEAAREAAEKDKRLASSGVDVAAFDAELDKLREDEAALELEDADSLVTLRFWELPGPEWGDITTRNPARPDVEQDIRFGYNVHGATVDAAQVNGRVVEDGNLIELSDDEWERFWPQLAGQYFTNISDAIFNLNVWDPAVRRDRLGKVSAGRSVN